MVNHQVLLDDFHFNKMIEVRAVGNSGGLVVLWDDNMLELDEIATTEQEIHLFSCIYASTYRNKRKILWQNLQTIKINFGGRWLIGGGFNELLSNSDKKGGNALSNPCTRDFWNVINFCEFIDMGFKGSKYTWLNKSFPDAQVLHLPKTHSDHCPLLLSLLKNVNFKKERIFRFESMWSSHPELVNIIQNVWNNNPNLPTAINKFERDVTIWNRDTFGNIFYKKNKLIRRLQGIQKSENYPESQFLINLEQNLIQEYNTILKMEEEFWKLKSRINWLNEGDAKTKFFHTSTLNCRRRNKILSLQLDDDSWIYD
ncbi:hypothetical protein R3W88_021121 [Solanum pinnatisectum]|uniref:Endonuclease/exonuclease/phosphatase domain-containing protein n=1 Tax=Solanum pinnatisectum TaxID=50273 RepID=A0AAV9LRM6_9SOLN|nr:hypothetical protein R3W88_021121 [Solanum pinnatisectum]